MIASGCVPDTRGGVGIKDRPPAPTFEDFSKRFTTWLATEKAEKPNTVAFYRDRVRQLLQYDKHARRYWTKFRKSLFLTTSNGVPKRRGNTHSERSKESERADTFEPVSVACVNRDPATLRRMLNLARLWKVIPAVPIIKLLPGERGHERVLNHVEESQYLGEAAGKPATGWVFPAKQSSQTRSVFNN